ncbi:DUF6220 domain-containing protein [Halobacillus rhizosphaerae]|uniref:DUF6220 domain-containing protein n=1 Tax=Halobacillus rhizosphaerae TaxID=3064889 RepID=UPI00398B7267
MEKLSSSKNNLMQDPVLSKSTKYGRYLFLGAAIIFVVCIVTQVFLAGMAVFVDPVNWSKHVAFVRIFNFLPLLMLLFAIIGKLGKDLYSVTTAMIIMIVLQYITANLTDVVPYLSALHVIFALMLFGASTNTVRMSWKKITVKDSIQTGG